MTHKDGASAMQPKRFLALVSTPSSRVVSCLLLTVVWTFVPPSVHAGVLSGDPNAIPGFTGTQTFAESLVIPPLNVDDSFQADVDFAVYAPGDFALTFPPGDDPSGGTQYVYAYQIFNTGVPGDGLISGFSVGFDGQLAEQPSNIGFFGAGQDPNSASFAEAVPPFTSARYLYTEPAPPNLLGLGSNSSILIYTSPQPPEFGPATMQDNQALVDSQSLPNPIPEPSALLLLAIGAASLSVRFVSRRRK